MQDDEITDGDDLLRQIWEAPGDPIRLSVYADWLLEHGDAARGEYMQLALLARRLAPTPEQTARREAIFRKHRSRWLGPARSYVRNWSDSERTPGFPSRMTCTAEQLAGGFELIRDLSPELVVILDWTQPLEGLLPSLPLGQLHGLSLDVGHDKLLRRLKLDGLFRLELFVESSRFTPDGLVGAVAHIASLRELELASETPLDGHLRAILDSPLAARLSALEIIEPFDRTLREVAIRAFVGRTLVFLQPHRGKP